MTDRAFAEITSRLYTAAMARADWPAVMQRLADLLHCEHALILARESWQGNITFWASAGLDASGQERFQSPRAAEIGVPLLQAAPLGRVCTRAEFLSDREFERSRYYEEIVRPARGFRSLNVVLASALSGAAILAFCRPRAAPEFDSRDAARLRRLMPHLEAAIGLSVRLNRSDETVRSLRTLLDALDCGAMLVDAAAHPHFINRRAMHLLAELDGLKITPAGLAISTPQRTAELRAVIAQAMAHAATGEGAARKQRLSVPRPSTRPPWLLMVAPLPGHEQITPAGVALAAIFIEESAASGAVDARLVSEAFRLTHREAEVAVLIAGGADPRAVAAALGIGIGTVRTHLKHVFDKTGQRNQTRLALKLRAFAGRA